MKEVLGSSFSYDLLQLMFALPYLKIELLQKKEIAHRQTASTWLKKLTDADIVRPQKMGRTTYYVIGSVHLIFDFFIKNSTH